MLMFSAALAQGPGFYIAMTGTGLASCSAITGPIAGRTWCADGTTLSWKVYNGSTFVAGGTGGVTTFNNLTGAVVLQGTTNQVQLTTVSNTITLGLPQSIATSSSPTFNAMTLNGLLTLNAGAIVQHDQYYKSLSSAAATKNLLGINTSDPNSSQLGSNVITVGQNLPMRFGVGNEDPKPFVFGRNTGSRYPTFNVGSSLVFIGGAFNATQTDTNSSGSPADLTVHGVSIQPTSRPPNGWSTGTNTLAILGQYLSGEAQTATTGKHYVYSTFVDMMPIGINGSATIGGTAAMWIENVYATPVTDVGPFGEPVRYVIYQPNSGNPNRFDDVGYWNAGIYTASVTSHAPGPAGINPQTGNPLLLAASAATAGSSPGARGGGSVTIQAGSAARTSTGNANGGDIVLTVGAPIGSGAYGLVYPSVDGTHIGTIDNRFFGDFQAIRLWQLSGDANPFAFVGDNSIQLGPGGATGLQVYLKGISSNILTIDSNGSGGAAQVRISGLKTTGSAAGKVMVCVDTSNGQLYASTSDAACAN